MIRRIAWFLAAATASPAAHASLCDFYKSNNPELYKIICQGGGSSAGKPAGANSTFSSAFNLTSASLPTEPSSYGLETLLHRIRDGDGVIAPTFSLVKGFQKFGTGISTGSNNTFYGDDITRRIGGSPELRDFKPGEAERGSVPNLNIGTAISLYEVKKGPTFRLGLSARYNKISSTWGGGPALLASWTYFSLGAGFTREQVSNFLPRITFISAQASARIWIFEFQYDRLANDAGFGLEPVQIFTTTMTIKHLVLTAARRHLNYVSFGARTQTHLAVQYLFSSHVSAGILYNYIPGATSLGLQYFL